ncbi:MAG: hypothetical protein JW892_14760, partial [Anaerolineae bacterium]|nr:hypothetical protein [Anaerolineae bacterium]
QGHDGTSGAGVSPDPAPRLISTEIDTLPQDARCFWVRRKLIFGDGAKPHRQKSIKEKVFAC